jgi:hypothetical protein
MGMARCIFREIARPSKRRSLSVAAFTIEARSGVMTVTFVSQVCRKVLTLISGSTLLSALCAWCDSSVSAANAQSGRSSPKLRYDFSHVTAMASFLATMSSRFFPPRSAGA